MYVIVIINYIPERLLEKLCNPKSDKVEVIKNGVISRLGYLNLKSKNLNRRQGLRNYRYR